MVEADVVVVVLDARRGSDTEEIWSTFFNAVEVWVRAVYLMERLKTKLCMRDASLTPESSPVWGFLRSSSGQQLRGRRMFKISNSGMKSRLRDELESKAGEEEELVCGPPSCELAETKIRPLRQG